MSAATQVLEFVNTTLNPHGAPVADTSLDLIATGMLDSIGMLELVVFLESEFGVQVSNDDLHPEHFATADAIARFVETAQARS